MIIVFNNKSLNDPYYGPHTHDLAYCSSHNSILHYIADHLEIIRVYINAN